MKKNHPVGNYRWTICALVFFATTINYLDRQVISLLKPYLETAGLFGSDPAHYESVYANIVIAFQLGFASGMLLIGRVIDKYGTKIGYAASLLGWSLAAIGHAFAKGPFGFGVARVALGVPEAGNYPAANKTIAEWFPKKERALATGIAISGTNIGAILAPIVVPFIAMQYGWKWAFIITGAIGLIWLIFWKIGYDLPHKKLAKGWVSQEEFDYIHSDPDENNRRKSEEIANSESIQSTQTVQQNKDALNSSLGASTKASMGWWALFGYKQTWAFFIGKFLTDPVWWFILFWLPAFLKEQYGLTGTQVSVPIVLVYTMTMIGSIFGGWLPKFLMERGMVPHQARKTAMFLYALIPLLIVSVQWLGTFNMWYAIIIVGLVAAAHQAWSANIFTTVSDMFPKQAIASVTGIGGMAGAVGGMLISKCTGILLDHYKALGNIKTGYGIIFMVCATAYLIAWILMHWLVPSFKKVDA